MNRKIQWIRSGIAAGLILLFFLLQTTVFQSLALASISPNMMIILPSSYGFMRGKKEGMIVGFFCGLLMDIFYGVGGIIGIYALLYLLIGFLNGFFRQVFYSANVKLPLLLVTGSDFLYGILNYIFLFLMRSKFQFSFYFRHVIVPEAIYTLAITLFVYQLLLWINVRLDQAERRSDSNLV